MHCYKMSFKLKRMKRTIILSLLSFVLVLFLMLNLMMVQLNSSTDPKEQPEIFPKEGKISEIIDHNIYKAQIRRKPKTANFDETDNEMSPANNENIINDNLHREVELKGETQKDLEKNNIQDDQMVEDMESIDDLYKDDYDNNDYDDDLNDANDDNDDAVDSDEDDNDDEYDYDDNIDQQYNHKRNKEKNEIAQYSNSLKTNPVFKPGDFGDITGLEYYRRPKLKVEELPNDIKVDPDKVSEAKSAAAKPTEKHVLIENGIYWSSYVETQVPKGKNAQEVGRGSGYLGLKSNSTIFQSCCDPFVLWGVNVSCSRIQHGAASFRYMDSTISPKAKISSFLTLFSECKTLFFVFS